MKRSLESDGSHSVSVASFTYLRADPDGHNSKIIKLDTATGINSNEGIEMKCTLPPHREVLVFTSYGEYETHYHKAHCNSCLQCGSTFPSSHLLEIHIEEFHDAFIAAKKEKGCDRKCRTYQKRRFHLINKHMYPKNYFFGVTKFGIKGRRSMLNEDSERPKHIQGSIGISSIPAQDSHTMNAQNKSEAMNPRAGESEHEEPGRSLQTTMSATLADGEKAITEVEVERHRPAPEADMEDIANSMAALTFIPRSIRFGRGGKSGFSRR